MDKLIKLKKRSKKRVGRGYSSGKGGHTIGRGAKGQKARNKIGVFFSGMKTKKSLIKKLPLQRGKGKFKPLKPRLLPVDVSLLNLFKKDEKVDLQALVAKGVIRAKDALDGVKILGKSEVKLPVQVLVNCSAGARAAIEKAGGTVGVKSQKKTKSATKKVATKK